MPDQDGSLFFWVVIIGWLLVFMFLPQWMARRRQRRREADLQIGDSVITIGGLIGDLTHIDFEANLARIRLAENVEISILPGAISGKRAVPSTASDDANEDSQADEAEVEADESPPAEL
jgi:preprotein translocase YajC subunit